MISGTPVDIAGIEATGPGGAVVTFATPTASDLVDGNLSVSADHPSGSTFPVGTTTIHFTATDAHGNHASTAFLVTVVDTARPVISAPTDITAEATSGAGAVVSFDATASDVVDGSVTVVATPPSGSTFPLGNTHVNLSTTDANGNTSTTTFTVSVLDTTPPVISGTTAANLSLEATDAGGAVVTFATPTASDLVDGNVSVAADHPSGSTFPVGTTTVHFTATDGHGNHASTAFLVTVVDTSAPFVRPRPTSPPRRPAVPAPW